MKEQQKGDTGGILVVVLVCRCAAEMRYAILPITGATEAAILRPPFFYRGIVNAFLRVFRRLSC